MFDRLLDLILTFLEAFRCCVIIMEYEGGVHLRWGLFYRELKPGLRFLCPLYIDCYKKTNTVLKTDNMVMQSLWSKDGHNVMLSVSIRYAIRNIKRWLLEVDEAQKMLHDLTYGIISDYILSHDWDDIRKAESQGEIFEMLKTQVSRDMGVKLERLKFCDLTRSKSLRILQE
jgi:regulator of protease activity HflC (stomatin/prohibitin superfamily)